MLIDAISDMLFCARQADADTLRLEGLRDAKLFLVGDVLADTVTHNLDPAHQVLNGNGDLHEPPLLWEGKTAARIVSILVHPPEGKTVGTGQSGVCMLGFQNVCEGQPVRSIA